ncbi:hypothetical protein BPNPMPFG_002406 [Mesorhizobium sp. AR07]|uniref:ribonuclease toxin HepT-like protein n=1 Tax=Mesorhizobium sp. AR07 TaxID=2865838 RepID=UPI00215E8A46|nr:hypothetical protein [Mesorhizobium sp. AR07]UVK46704.1 hypothetical protein BPNPMPFG_002406 [Mesorhizobium sp. AR07]
MTAFKHPAFAKLSPKIDRAAKELQQIGEYLSAHGSEMSLGEWGAVAAVSLGIHNVYNGIEDVLLSLANDIDGLVPKGPTMHQDVLDQMSVEIAGIRLAVLDPELYESLSELKGFRHLVRHRYGFDLKTDTVQENLDRVKEAFPSFVGAIVSLERTLTEENTHDNDGGDGSGGGASGGP